MKIGHNKGKKYNVLKDTTQQLILKGIVADAIKVKSTSKNNRLPHKYLSTIVQQHVLGFRFKPSRMPSNQIRIQLVAHHHPLPLIVKREVDQLDPLMSTNETLISQLLPP